MVVVAGSVSASVDVIVDVAAAAVDNKNAIASAGMLRHHNPGVCGRVKYGKKCFYLPDLRL